MGLRAVAVAVTLALLAPSAADAVDDSAAQLETVRARIRDLESQLHRLAAETSAVAREREQLEAELELAEARVRENEIVVAASRQEADQLRLETAAVAEELASRRMVLARHLEMTALLGGPGPLQLLFDGARGGDLEEAVEVSLDGSSLLVSFVFVGFNEISHLVGNGAFGIPDRL